MHLQSRIMRLLAGTGIMLVLLVASFTAVLPAIHRWGATDAEVARTLPGDELLASPQILWTNAVTINAPPAQVWPWIAQLGDTRGGFYSYTFIENRVGSITGASSYQVVYQNADQIVPEWQNPAPGDSLIQDTLQVRAVQPGSWLLAATEQPAAFGWTWLWSLEPLNSGAQTRLVSRVRIQTPPEMTNPAASVMMDLGGFVMQQRLMHGIALRAEGGHEPVWMEGAEITIWCIALICGLVAGGLFVFRPGWQHPLAVGVAAIVVLFVLTFVQPPLWLRLLLDTGLLAGVWWAASAQAQERWTTSQIQTAKHGSIVR
jgi:hypothetical protein